jgi:hypothetical protein
MEPDNTGVMTEAAVQAPAAIQNDVGQSQHQDQMVPVAALQAIRQEKQQLQENLRLMQDHLALLRANSPAQKAPEPELRDDDVLTVGEARKFLEAEKRQTQTELAELKMQQTYPDYADVVRNYLPQALKEDPELRDEIQSSQNPFKLAYKLAKRSEAYQKAQRERSSSPEAAKAIANAQRPGNLSSVGSVSPVSQVAAWKSMSDADFMKQVQKNLGYS